MDYFNQQSERLVFRKLNKADIPIWETFFSANDSLEFLGLDLSISHKKLAAEWILRQLERYEKVGLGHLAVTLKETGEFIGMGGIIPRNIENNDEFEIAYSILPKHWKQGYGTEIAKQLKAFGSKHINTERFISIIDVNNIRSINVAKKNGMKVQFRTNYMGMLVDVYGIKIEGTKN